MSKKMIALLTNILLISISLFAQENSDFSVVLKIKNSTTEYFLLTHIDESTGISNNDIGNFFEISPNSDLTIEYDKFFDRGKKYSFVAKNNSKTIEINFENILIPDKWYTDTFTIEWDLVENKGSNPTIEKIEYYKRESSDSEPKLTVFIPSTPTNTENDNLEEQENIHFENVDIISPIRIYYNKPMNKDLTIDAFDIIDKNERKSIPVKVTTHSEDDKSIFTINFEERSLDSNKIYEIKIYKTFSTLGESLDLVSMRFMAASTYKLKPSEIINTKFSEKEISIEWKSLFLFAEDTLHFKAESGKWEIAPDDSLKRQERGKYFYTSDADWTFPIYEFRIVSKIENEPVAETLSFYVHNINVTTEQKITAASVILKFSSPVFIEKYTDFLDVRLYKKTNGAEVFIMNLTQENNFTYSYDSTNKEPESTEEYIIEISHAREADKIIYKSEKEIEVKHASGWKYFVNSQIGRTGFSIAPANVLLVPDQALTPASQKDDYIPESNPGWQDYVSCELFELSGYWNFLDTFIKKETLLDNIFVGASWTLYNFPLGTKFLGLAGFNMTFCERFNPYILGGAGGFFHSEYSGFVARGAIGADILISEFNIPSLKKTQPIFSVTIEYSLDWYRSIDSGQSHDIGFVDRFSIGFGLKFD